MTERTIPIYLRDLSDDERRAVHDRAVQRARDELLSCFSDQKKPAPISLVCQFSATLMVKAAWQADRIDDLEKRVAEIEADAASKATPPPKKPASKNKKDAR